MSLTMMVWVLEHSEARLADRLVLLALAEYAHDDGSNAWPSVATIARKANLSERQARYSLRSLEAAGAIEPTGTSHTGTTVYAVLTPPAKSAPPAESGSETTNSAPDPLEPPTTSVETATALGENRNGNDPHPRSAVVAHARPERPKITHNRRPIPESELDAALAILAAFNAAAGTRRQPFTGAGKASESLSIILGALAGYPEVAELAPRMIAAAFRAPWWKGRPSPNVVFGPKVVERFIDEARLGKPDDAERTPARDWLERRRDADNVIDSTATETGAA